MTRVTGYKCIFQTNDERFKFALTLDDEGQGGFVVGDADAVETLLDMFEDSSEAHFDSESGELTFAFEELETEEEEEQEDDESEDEDEEGEEDADSETDDDAEKHASPEESSLEADESGEEADDEEDTRRAKKTRSRRPAA